MDLWKIIVSVIIAISGWIIAHYFTSKREARNKRREIRVSYLIDAYQKLENAIQRSPQVVGSDLESVVANIQLFGSAEQISLTKEVSNGISNNGSVDLEQLLQCLRTDLREELQLSKTDDQIQFLRMIGK